MNGRPVEGTQLGKELTRHFRRQFDQRRKWPFAVIALTLPVDYFDVNLAPNKRAVLMRDEETLTSYWRSYLNALYPRPCLACQTRATDLLQHPCQVRNVTRVVRSELTLLADQRPSHTQ